MKNHWTIEAATWPEHQAKIIPIRTTVFIQEQQVPEELEWDDADEECFHWLAYDEDNVIGCCRMKKNGHIGRMAVLNNYRGKGVGRALLDTATTFAQSIQLFECFLYSQTQAIPFYRKAGFIVTGEEFFDAGIAHQSMRLQIAERRLLGVHGGDFSVNDFGETAFELISQASKQLRILSVSLDHNVFDNKAMTDAISALARSSRYAEIRLMVIDPKPMITRGHQLLSLQRKLPSKIHLRRCTAQLHDIKDSLILADQVGLINQSIKAPEKTSADFNNRPVTENYISIFDDFWEHAVVDNDLRQLSI